MPDRFAPPGGWDAFARSDAEGRAAPFPASTPISIFDRAGPRAIATLDLAAPPAPSGPRVSCLMVTRGRLFPARHAIACFRRQTYADRELVIVDDSVDGPLAAFVDTLGDEHIRYLRLPPADATLGELRNLAVARATGDLVCQWDDDDLCDPLRLELSVKALQAGRAAAVFLERWIMWWPRLRRLTVSGPRPWEGSMLVARDALPAYPSLRQGEDSLVVRTIVRSCRIVLLDQPRLYCYNVTGQNTWDGMHFEEMFLESSVRCGPDDYERALDDLDRRIPVRAFERDLAAAPTRRLPASTGIAAELAHAEPAAGTATAPLPAATVTAAPTVSIVVCGTGRAELLDTLWSLARQSCAGLDVVVVEAGGAGDGPPAGLPPGLALRFVGAGDSPTRAAAVNRGLAATTGDYLGIVDDGDLFEPTHVARLVARATAADRPDLVFAGAWLLDRFQRVVGARLDPYAALTAYFRRPFLTASALFHRRHLERGRRFDETLGTAADWDFWLQLMTDARVGRVDAITHFRRWRESAPDDDRGAPGAMRALQDRWQRQRNALWLAHHERFGPGIALQNERRLAEAHRYFARLVGDNPGEPNALFQLGQTLGQEGYLHAARNLLARAIAGNADAGEYYMALARIEEALTNFAAAIAHFGTAARLTPRQAPIANAEIGRLRARLPAAATVGAVTVGPAPVAGVTAVARNAACPCGSGLRYKACCGKSGPSVPPPEAPADGVWASADSVSSLLIAAQDAYRSGEPAAARELFDAVLRAHPHDPAALAACARLDCDYGNAAAARDALLRLPPGARAEPETAALLALLDRSLSGDDENRRAADAIRALPFMLADPVMQAAAAAAAGPLHIVIAAGDAARSVLPETALAWARLLADRADVHCWAAEALDQTGATPDGLRAVAPDRGEFPREGTVLFAGIPELPPIWLRDAAATRLAVRHFPEHAADVLELLVACHRESGLPVRLLLRSDAERARLELPGAVVRDPLDVEALRPSPRGGGGVGTFTVGFAGRNDPREFHPDDPRLWRRFAAAGMRTRVLGGTILMRYFAASAQDPLIELLPVDAVAPAAFLATLDCLVFRPGPNRPPSLPAMVDTAMAAGLPVVCAREAAAAEVIHDGVDGFLFADEGALDAIVDRLRNDGALRVRTGAAAAAAAHARYGDAYRERLAAVLLG